jgi:hypothetical protein
MNDTKNNGKVIVTDHGTQRIKDRLGLSKKIADKTAQKALDRGVGHSETKGNLRRYIDKVYYSEQKANNIRVYNRKIYLFRDDVLITVLNLPHNLSSIADKIQKNKLKVQSQ